MDKSSIKKQISNLIIGNTVHIDEYQDKYYFAKGLKELFPNFSDEDIYYSIQLANNTLQGSRKKRKYVNMLLNILEKIQQNEGEKWGTK